MKRFLVTWLCSAGAIAASAWIFAGIKISGPRTTTGEDLVTLAVVAAIFAVISIVVAPVVKILSIPFIILTLGLALLVINALLLYLTAWVADAIDVRFVVEGFWTAVGGALVISLVNAALQSLFDDDRTRARR